MEVSGQMGGRLVSAPQIMLVVAIFKITIWCLHFSVFVMWTGVCEREKQRRERGRKRETHHSVSLPKFKEAKDSSQEPDFRNLSRY